MAIEVRELYLSRDNSLTTEGATKTVRFSVRNTDDENAAQFALIVYTPLYAFGVGGLPHRRSKIGLTRKGPGLWLAEVEYEWTKQVEEPTEDTEDHDPLGIEWTFDGTGGTIHITQSISTLFARAAGDARGNAEDLPLLGTAPDNKKAIGLTWDAVQGCDIVAPHMELTATLNYVGLTFGAVRQWGKLTGKINGSRWKGFEAGQLLYLGPTGNAQPGQLAKATHKFSFGEILEHGDPRLIIRPGVVGVDRIELPEKEPFDYLWCGYKPQDAAGTILQLPTAAYVEQVYKDGDFTVLGLGS